METFLNWTLGLGIFLLVITLSVAVHEAGHLLVAKGLKITVPRYFVGFGPTLWSRKYRGTEYGVKAIPLGGFIVVEDLKQPEGSPERALLSHVSPWKRFLIFVAGPAVNIFVAVLILFVLFLVVPLQVGTTTIKSVETCAEKPMNCEAEKAGFLPGDKVLSVDGVAITSAGDFAGKFQREGSLVVVERGGQELTLTPKSNEDMKIGVNLVTAPKARGPQEAWDSVTLLFTMNLKALTTLPAKIPNLIASVAGEEPRAQDSVSSMVGVGRVYGQTADNATTTTLNKVQTFVFYSALLNLGLGFANLLPILPLDGGRILIAAMDSVRLQWARLRRKVYTPIGYKWVSAMTAVTGTALMCFVILIVVADIVAPVVG